MKKKNKKRGGWILWVSFALMIGILAALPMLSAGREESDGVRASIRSSGADYADISTVLVGGGQLSSSGTCSVKIPENVRIREYLVSNGDIVQEGDPIALVDSVSVMYAISQVQDTLNELSDQINKANNTSAAGTIKASPSGRIKKIYARAGDSVEDVMLTYGALAVLSLDDTMAVQLTVPSALSPGERVTVTINGNHADGRVRSNVNGVLTVTVEDNHYTIGTPAEITTREGQLLGSGALYVYNAWNVTAYSGTISGVSVSEEQTVYANQALFSVTESGKSSEFQKAVDKRQVYEELMHELFRMYRSGVVTAPCTGIVSGADTSGSYMLSAAEENSDSHLIFLSSVSYSVQIVTQTLPAGAVGNSYAAPLLASRGDEPVSGTWAVTGLPGGLTLDSGSGLISGIPTVSGSFPVQVSFASDSDAYCSSEMTLVIAPADAPDAAAYFGYPARVTIAGGNVIQVMRAEDPYSISDPETLPTVAIDTLELTVEAVYDGQAIVDGHFKEGDLLWIILDSDETVVKAQKINSSGNTPGGGQGSSDGSGGSGQRPSGGSGGGSFGGGSMPSGSTAQAENDGLYSRERIEIAMITSQERMTVSITVDELDITRIYIGQTAVLSINTLPGVPIDAVVTQIANAGENSGGNSKFTIELELARSGDMLPGMNATATFTLAVAEKALCVPAAAVYELGGKTVVYTAQDANGSLIMPMEVTLGAADADRVQILSGLSEGTTVYYEIYEQQDALPFMTV